MSNELESSGKSNWVRSTIVIAVAMGLGYALLVTGPVTTPEEEKRPPKVVKTVAPKPATHPISITAHGSVLPSRRVVIQPQVSGEILRQHPDLIPGGFVAEGEDLFEIDSYFARLSARESVAAVARAEALLKEAKRKREEALRLANEKVIAVTELAEWESQVETQRAELQRLQAVRDRDAELLSRHVLRAPFNAMVLEESVEIGQRVGSSYEAVTLVGTDEFWVRVALSMDKLRWVKLPTKGEKGAKVDVFLEMGDGYTEKHTGRVVRLLSDLEREGRMARVLVSVNDPMGFKKDSKKAPLLIGSYVRVEIEAGELEQVLAVQRDALREQDRVWICDANNELQIRDVEVLWRRNETVYLSNVLEEGETLIVSPLRSALPGMKVNPQAMDAPGSKREQSE
jgi:RND family efflux transporter MFP subunit